jgi:hypothetical protein
MGVATTYKVAAFVGGALDVAPAVVISACILLSGSGQVES